MMPREVKIYTVAGLKWKQTELERKDFAKLTGYRDNLLEEISQLKTFADAMRYIDETKLIDDMFALILTPYGETLKDRVWHWFARRWRGINTRNISERMTWAEIGEVVSDFFTMNTKFINNFVSMEKALGLSSTIPSPSTDSPKTS